MNWLTEIERDERNVGVCEEDRRCRMTRIEPYLAYSFDSCLSVTSLSALRTLRRIAAAE